MNCFLKTAHEPSDEEKYILLWVGPDISHVLMKNVIVGLDLISERVR
jgi:hypothetical protein